MDVPGAPDDVLRTIEGQDVTLALIKPTGFSEGPVRKVLRIIEERGFSILAHKKLRVSPCRHVDVRADASAPPATCLHTAGIFLAYSTVAT